ncbi:MULTISPECIES: tetratricopeptide repeat protein [Flavobacterium]|uniref:tetratricopeptide repeat protein n=1 Tax=Flavobacterium TaxID=237 RepID=UPI0022AC4848|nr:MULTISPECIES: hypothetical protein [Flavobacterium]
MKIILKILFFFLLFIPSISAQKSQIKEALKLMKYGDSEQVIVVLSPIAYLIGNASNEDKIHFYYLKGTALVDLANKNINTFKNLTEAIFAFNDLIQVEIESNDDKFISQATKSLFEIKRKLIDSANEDVAFENYTTSSDKFYQAYLIDKKDTLQLYQAAISYRNGSENNLALQCFEELKGMNYSGNVPVYIAYSKELLKEEYFTTIEERNEKIKSGTHLRPRTELISKKAEIYKSMAMIYIQKGYKEKALKMIAQARKLNNQDQALSFIEANLYLQTKDYELFDSLASIIIESNPNNAEVLANFGINCQNEQYYEGAEYYYKKAIETDPKNITAYVNLSALLAEKSIKITNKINDMEASSSDKKVYLELKKEREQIVKTIKPYLQKIVCIDPFNNSVSQLMNSLNFTKKTVSLSALASED